MRMGNPETPWRCGVAVLLALAGLVGAARAQDAQGTDFYIVNSSPVTIEQAYVSPTGDRNWGRDRLNGATIARGDSFLIRDTIQDGCQGDVRVVFEGGVQVERRNQNFCRVNRMYFSAPARPNRRTQNLDITLRNESDAQIDGIFITRAGEREWGRNWLGANEAIEGKGRKRIGVGADLGCQIDVRASYHGGNNVEFYNENICALSTLAFFAPQTDQGAQRPLPDARQGAPGGTDPDQPQGRDRERTDVQPPGVRPSETGPPRGAGSGNVTIVNNYRVPLRELYVSPANAREWGRDFLPEQVLVQPSDRYAVRVDTSQDCQFDVKAVWDSEAEQTIRNTNLCTGRPVALSGPAPGAKLWSGTGFYVARGGHVLTNNHVIYGCSSVVISRPGGAAVPLRVVAQDTVHDLALLQDSSVSAPGVIFRAPGSALRAGEPSISLGYPIRELLGSLIVTSGIVSSVSGGRGDETQFQMQTPIQPGNSGGPVFDESGLLIGVSVAQITRAGGRAVQNVNFAVKAEVARRFVEAQGVHVETAAPRAKLSTADITEQQQNRVLALTCIN